MKKIRPEDASSGFIVHGGHRDAAARGSVVWRYDSVHTEVFLSPPHGGLYMEILNKFIEVAANPAAYAAKIKASGRPVIGYYLSLIHI